MALRLAVDPHLLWMTLVGAVRLRRLFVTIVTVLPENRPPARCFGEHPRVCLIGVPSLSVPFSFFALCVRGCGSTLRFVFIVLPSPLSVGGVGPFWMNRSKRG